MSTILPSYTNSLINPVVLADIPFRYHVTFLELNGMVYVKSDISTMLLQRTEEIFFAFDHNLVSDFYQVDNDINCTSKYDMP